MRFRRQILALLLTAMALFVVHDLVIVTIDSDTQVELCAAPHDHSALDAPSTLHEFIHHALDLVAPRQVILPRESYPPIAFEYRFTPTERFRSGIERPPTL